MAVVLIVGSPTDAREEELARALRERGLETVLAGAGEEALGSIRGSEPDAIVLRLDLPDVEAVRWIESLRAAGCRRPLVYSAAQTVDPDAFRRLTRELGVRLVLREPVVPALLADQVASLVAATGQDAGPRTGFAEEMASLRAEYATALPGKIDELSRAARLARERPHDLDRAWGVKKLAHALRGTAGTFGFPGVSEAAGRIEEAANRHIQGPAADTEALAEIEGLLAAARAGLAGED